MHKRIKYTLIAFCALCLLLAGALIMREIDARKTPALLLETREQRNSVLSSNTTAPNATLSEALAIPDAIPSSTLTDDIAIVSVDNTFDTLITSKIPKVIADDLGALSIQNKTYVIKKGVDEATLKKNIGWMESSALPGEDGVCVLMGHRNTQLRILKDAKRGDAVAITDIEGTQHVYIVQSAEIVKNGEPMHFEASDGKSLMMVTCYPFFYQGHAPDKYIVHADMN